MTVQQLVQQAELTALSLPDPQREITGVYCGDLLSWVMGRACGGDAWITIMSNRNVPAVATLADTACVILAEGVAPDEGVAELAQQKGVNLLQSSRSTYETAVLLRDLL